MKKWLLRIVYAVVAMIPVAAVADYTATTGSGSTIFAFVCSTTKICPAFVLIDSSNVEKATSGNPLRTDPTGTTTQPVSAASLPLPTGAATSANQPTSAAQGSTTSGQTGTLVQCAVTTAAPTYTTAQTDPLSCDTAGNARVNVTTSALPTNAATSTKQSDGTQKSQVVDASGNVQPSGDVAARAIFEKVTDGTNTAAVKAAATPVGNSDPALGVVTSNYTAQATTLSAWTSATTVNTTQSLMAVGQGTPSILVQLNQTSTLTVGAVTFEGTYDNTNWVSIPVSQVLNPNTLAPLTNPYTLVASTNQPFLILTQGYQAVRIRLSTAITGTASVTPFVTLLPYNPTISGILNPLVAGSAVIGKVGIDQTTDGTTNGVRLTNAYPSGATPITASATGTTAATTATLAGTTGKTTYICGFSIRANATAAATGNATVTGTITGTLNYTQWTAPNASGLGVTEESFTPCVPASATNTGIAVVSAAPGTGGVVSSTAWGFQQ